MAIIWLWAVCVRDVEDEREEGMTEPYLTLATYLFGALLVVMILVGALELVGWLPMPE